MSPSSRLIKQAHLRGLSSKHGSSTRLGPFLKWAGGKSQLLASYEEYFPQEFNRYFEPFTGGAAVFFHLRNTRGAFPAELTDSNQELINCYLTIKDDLDALIIDLQKHENNQEYFYNLRALDTSTLSNVERASRLIYLNKTCFNGLYRVNSKGKFNVPFGFYKNPSTCNEALLAACSEALQKAQISCKPFDHVLRKAKKGDFVYIDPPYHPLNSTSNFTSYTRDCFSADDQIRLAEVYAELDRRGCLLMLSNSDCPFIRDLYSQFNTKTVYAMRMINCKAEGRGKISEVLVLNY